MHDFAYPPNPTVARIWGVYFKLLQKIGSWKYPQWRTIFYELPGLIQKTKWVAELSTSLEENGFSEIQIQLLTFGTATLVAARKR